MSEDMSQDMSVRMSEDVRKNVRRFPEVSTSVCADWQDHFKGRLKALHEKASVSQSMGFCFLLPPLQTRGAKDWAGSYNGSRGMTASLRMLPQPWNL